MPYTSLLKGFHLQKNGKEIRRPTFHRSTSSVGCSEYDPNLVMDTMSFAQTPDAPSSALTSNDDLLSPEMPDAPVHAIRMDNLGADATMTSATYTRNEDVDDVDEVERDRQDREEERGFLRALGLEFDEIARRAEHL